MSTATNPDSALLRLLHLVSPTLPVGAFTYSQGIEWAVEAGWVTDASELEQWLSGQVDTVVARVDVPLLARLYEACARDDAEALAGWVAQVVAWRETAELRAEERARGRAFADLLVALSVPNAAAWRDHLAESQLAGFALAAVHWGVARDQTALGYAWTWLENLVLAAVKLIPLGQSSGQQVLQRLIQCLPSAVHTGLALADEDIGASLPALAIASSAHETQYTRLFRS
jgi:urease accessory protein